MKRELSIFIYKRKIKMFLTEYLIIDFKNNKRIKLWEKKLNCIIDAPQKIHWKILKGSTYRVLSIDVECDECGIIHKRRIRDLSDSNYHLCNKCKKIGSRNGQYGKKQSEETKKALQLWRKENPNPFTWESVKIILKEKQEETSLKVASKNIGKKRTEETKEKMSKSIKNAYKEGRIVPGKGYNNIPIKEYKGIRYQGSYELKFLKFVEDYGKLNEIINGPRINYIFDNNEHSYFIDFMLKDTDIVFEIKSNYYWNKSKDVNLVKKETAEKCYNYNLVMDNNFKKIKKLFK